MERILAFTLMQRMNSDIIGINALFEISALCEADNCMTKTIGWQMINKIY